MKRIILNFAYNPYGQHEPRTFAVEYEDKDRNYIEVSRKDGFSNSRMILTKLPNGNYVNENRVEYVRVKPDRRPKPFSVMYQSGIGEGAATKKFATLSEVQEYVKGRWQGADYIDGPDIFHGDYGHFILKGCVLADLGQRKGPAGTDEYFDWEWKEVA